MIKKIKVLNNGDRKMSLVQIERIENQFVALVQFANYTKIIYYNSFLDEIDSEQISASYLDFKLLFKYFKIIGDRLNRTKYYTIRNQNIESINLNLESGWRVDDSNFGVSTDFMRVSKIENGVIHRKFLNVKTKCTSKLIDYSPHFIGNITVSYSRLMLNRVDPISLEVIWSRDLNSDLDHIEGMNRVINPIIGVHSDVFVFSYQGKWLVGVDITTGEISWKVSGNWSKSQILENGNIFVMVGSQMRLLAIKTGELIGEYGEVEGEIGPQRMNYTFIGDHVILTGRPSDTIGAYNTKTYKYDWIYKEEGTQWSPQPMKYYHPYLFVNDTKGNLHVFEMDDDLKF